MESSSKKENPSHLEIAILAEKIYRDSGCIPGRDVENWLLAEADLKEQKRGNISHLTEKPKQSQKILAPAPKARQAYKNSSVRSELAVTH
jgi:hypothetical protein